MSLHPCAPLVPDVGDVTMDPVDDPLGDVLPDDVVVGMERGVTGIDPDVMSEEGEVRKDELVPVVSKLSRLNGTLVAGMPLGVRT